MSHNYHDLWYLVIVYGPKFITIHNESKLFTRVIQVCNPLHVDGVMATIQQTFKCLELITGKWWAAIIV
jgi:hypothetical protein